VWCPDWSVVAWRRRDPGLCGVPVVVRERAGNRELVRAASVEARAEGVARGMRRREAEARCAGVVVVDVDEHLEARSFEAVARAVESFTPRVVLQRPGLLTFPTLGPARYFGGDDALAARVHGAVAGVLGDPAAVRLAVADGAFAAGLAARRAVLGPVVVPPGESARFLAPFPVATLGDDVLADLLVRLGVRTLGDLAALPAPAVLARFGDHGMRCAALACGDDPDPPALVVPPPDLVETAELDPPATRVDVAAFAAKSLADRLLARLAARGLACTRVLVEAETEHGERVSRCWRHAEGFTPATLTERVRWQLDGWVSASAADDADVDTTTGALTLVRLVPDEVVPAEGRQLGFWGGDAAARARADRACARVQGMLGHDAVVTFVVQGGRTPVERVRAVPWGEPREPLRPLAVGGEVPAWPGALPPPAPARVHEPPLPASLVDARGEPVTVSGRGEASSAPAWLRCAALPGGGGAVLGWAGPWAHDVRWWDPSARSRRARWQVVVDTGDAGTVACVVVLDAGAAAVEAIHD
jgi:protein ImuB